MDGENTRLAQINKWWYRLFYPYIRRKDAGYIANVLSEYRAIPLIDRRNLPNFADVERCVTALFMALDESPEADKEHLQELHQTLSQQMNPPAAALPLDGADPITDQVWLQSYMRQLFQVEKAVLDLQRFPALFARAPFLLERFRSLAGQKVEVLRRQYESDLSGDRLSKLWDAWTKPGNDKEKADNEIWLRSKLVALLNDIHWWYAQSQVREELFLGQQLVVISGFLIATVALFLAFMFECNCEQKLTTTVMFFGLLGAFTSIMRRMRSDADQHGGGGESSYKELTALAYGKIGITISLLFGMVFSLVLLLIFYGQLDKTVFSDAAAKLIFPDLPLTWPPGDDKCAGACLFSLNPESARQFGKLMVWSFLAGFAEQLVPDALNRLTTKALEKKS
jgi:hypothetical protein